MKKLYLLPLLAIAALTFNSCGNSDEPQGPTYEVFQLGLDDENIDYDANGAWKDLYTPDTRIVLALCRQKFWLRCLVRIRALKE